MPSGSTVSVWLWFGEQISQTLSVSQGTRRHVRHSYPVSKYSHDLKYFPIDGSMGRRQKSQVQTNVRHICEFALGPGDSSFCLDFWYFFYLIEFSFFFALCRFHMLLGGLEHRWSGITLENSSSTGDNMFEQFPSNLEQMMKRNHLLNRKRGSNYRQPDVGRPKTVLSLFTVSHALPGAKQTSHVDGQLYVPERGISNLFIAARRCHASIMNIVSRRNCIENEWKRKNNRWIQVVACEWWTRMADWTLQEPSS